MLDVENLRVRYENRSKPAVDGLSFHIDPGEFVLLMGGSASGKSTTMQAVCGFIPDIIQAEKSGTVTIEGEVFEDATSASKVACMVQQDPETQFCTETVEDEVAFGPENFNMPPSEIRRAVDRTLEAVRASHLVDRRLSTLSGGEKQKVAIASMLAVGPKLLILDEPTSNLDPRSVREVVSAVDGLRRNKSMTIVVVEHRPGQFIDLASRVMVMERGRLVLDRRRDAGLFADLVPVQRKGITPPRGRTEERAVVDVSGVGFSIKGERILDGVSFRLRKGAIAALMGENGAGKTTLLRLLTGLWQPDTGRISLLGHEFGAGAKAEPWVLGKDVGLVFQNPNHQIFERSVEKEILFASENYMVPKESAPEAVASFESTEGVRRFVHPHCLSFGQKRRVNIRSASSHGPGLVLMDEPFAGQDAANASSICEMMAELRANGVTVIVVTHDVDFVRSTCTDVIFMRKGCVTRTGPVPDITEAEWEQLYSGEAP
jgi:energy-coupling factor transporter ATP-binding protein EcfA2